MPENTRSVARPTAWGNPFRVGDRVGGWGVVRSRAEAVALFQQRITSPPEGHSYAELRGVNLACWCPLDGPCHADVLLERANAIGPDSSTGKQPANSTATSPQAATRTR